MAFMSLFTIYNRPADYPDRYVVREFFADPDGPVVGPVVGTALTLQAARELVPRSADACLPRNPEDDPVIVETWF